MQYRPARTGAMTHQPQHQLLAILADGRFHSGQDLGLRLHLGRGAIWKRIHTLRQLGVEVHAVRGKGYRLPHALELLQPEPILAAMDTVTRPSPEALEIHLQLDSTNTHLLQRASNGGPSGLACFAESQRAGRGRRGRHWVSPPAGNIYLSLLWRFDLDPTALAGLSLAIGVAGIRTLNEIGNGDWGLKWPNDLLWNDRKLGGILIELAGQVSGASAAVIGFGLNLQLPRASAAAIDQPWADLNAILPGPIPRNHLAGRLLHHLTLALTQFQAHGLAPFLEEYRRHDLLLGKAISLRGAGPAVTGIACGVNRNGALRVAHGERLQHYHSGEVSVRPA